MIRYNQWTKDYTYTYDITDGVSIFIHKKSNRPIVHWLKSWYNTNMCSCSTFKKRQLIER